MTLSKAFLRWNAAIAQHFFNPDNAGKNVYLYVNQDLIDELQKKMPDAGTFTSAVTNGERYHEPKDVCLLALRAYRHWRSTGDEIPPYIAFLGLYVLAADIEGDFAPNAYYPRLWELLGQRRTGGVPGFNQMWLLWDDLARWAVNDKLGAMGIFQSSTIGGFVHIGYPLSQSILAGRDRQALPAIFYDAGLDPTGFTPPSELAMALRSTTAKQMLRPRTLKLAEHPKDVRHPGLISVVADELSDWDGLVEKSYLNDNRRDSAFARLRIAVHLNRVARTVRCSLKCKLNHEFPETGIDLADGFSVEEDINGWSLPLIHSETGTELNASDLDWINGISMATTTGEYRLSLPGRSVRLFTNGLSEGLNGFVETEGLSRGESFLICYPQHAWPDLEFWASSQCRGFEVIDLIQGLPASWELASVEEAMDDKAVRDAFPILRFPSRVRLRLVGGIRSGPGNHFFSFAPPSVSLVGGRPDVELACNGEKLVPETGTNRFTIPDVAIEGSRADLEARTDNSVQRLSLFFTDDFSLSIADSTLIIGATGDPAQRDDESFCHIWCSHQTPFIQTNGFRRGVIPRFGRRSRVSARCADRPRSGRARNLASGTVPH